MTCMIRKETECMSRGKLRETFKRRSSRLSAFVASYVQPFSDALPAISKSLIAHFNVPPAYVRRVRLAFQVYQRRRNRYLLLNMNSFPWPRVSNGWSSWTWSWSNSSEWLLTCEILSLTITSQLTRDASIKSHETIYRLWSVIRQMCPHKENLMVVRMAEEYILGCLWSNDWVNNEEARPESGVDLGNSRKASLARHPSDSFSIRKSSSGMSRSVTSNLELSAAF